MKLPTRYKLPSLLVLALLPAACGSHELPPIEADPTSSSHVAKLEVESTDMECIAVVTSRSSQVLHAESDGQVEKLLVHDDQYVRKGDLIAQLDVSELRSKLNQAQGQLARAQGQAGHAYALAANAERKARVEGLMMRSGASSPEAWRSAQADAQAAGGEGAAAGGEIKAAKADIENDERLIAAADIKAPMDGTVSMIKIHEGEMAHRGATLGRVFDPGDIQVKFGLPRSHARAVKIGDHIELAYESDQKPLKLPAVVSEIIDDHDPAIDFLQVVAQIDKSNHPDVRVGIKGYVRIADSSPTAVAATTPATADKGAVR
jgi:RND family efflux transporter MFP subunit